MKRNMTDYVTTTLVAFDKVLFQESLRLKRNDESFLEKKVRIGNERFKNVKPAGWVDKNLPRFVGGINPYKK